MVIGVILANLAISWPHLGPHSSSFRMPGTSWKRSSLWRGWCHRSSGSGLGKHRNLTPCWNFQCLRSTSPKSSLLLDAPMGNESSGDGVSTNWRLKWRIFSMYHWIFVMVISAPKTRSRRSTVPYELAVVGTFENVGRNWPPKHQVEKLWISSGELFIETIHWY